eukprot:3176452-Amphidinium_carterae.1
MINSKAPPICETGLLGWEALRGLPSSIAPRVKHGVNGTAHVHEHHTVVYSLPSAFVVAAHCSRTAVAETQAQCRPPHLAPKRWQNVLALDPSAFYKLSWSSGLC